MGEREALTQLIAGLRTHAYDDCGGQELPTHICNVAADKLEALSTPSVAGGWRPIESARKDGAWIELAECGPSVSGETIIRALYAGWWDPEGEFWCAECGQPVVQAPEPTHWRPLSEPPCSTDNPPVDHPVAGEDLVMVPREPNNDMCVAGWRAGDKYSVSFGNGVAAEIYAAMLDAAPTMDGGGS